MVPKNVSQNTFYRMQCSVILHFCPTTLLNNDLYQMRSFRQCHHNLPSSFCDVSPALPAMDFGRTHHLLFVHQTFVCWLIATNVFIYHCWKLYSKVVIASSVLIGLVTGCHFPIICKSSNYQERRLLLLKMLVTEAEKQHTLSIMKLAWKFTIFTPAVINNSKQTNKK